MAGFPQPPTTMPDKTPHKYTAVASLWDAPCATTPPVPTPFRGSSRCRIPTLTVSSSCFIQKPAGLPEFSDVSLPACHGLGTPADRYTQAIPGALFYLPGRLYLSASATCLFLSCTSTSGSATSPMAYRILCVRLPCNWFSRLTPLRSRTIMRYGRAANPYPPGPFSTRVMPCLARRDDV